LPPQTQDLVRRYLARDDHDVAWDFIRLALSSVARYAIVPMQDLLALGSEGRMNTPSTVGDHNWSWRLRGGETHDEIVIGRLREMTELYGRTAPEEAERGIS
jgi:4-alpha-glucanotransferase